MSRILAMICSVVTSHLQCVREGNHVIDLLGDRAEGGSSDGALALDTNFVIPNLHHVGFKTCINRLQLLQS